MGPALGDDDGFVNFTERFRDLKLVVVLNQICVRIMLAEEIS